MNKQKIMKLALPALLMSALIFQAMPGSVRYYGASVPEKLLNFFNLENLPAAGYLVLASYATALAMVLAMVTAFSKKHQPLRLVSWCALIAGALTTAPYVIAQNGELLQPNVIITILLTGCWLLAFYMDKQKAKQDNAPDQGRRL